MPSNWHKVKEILGMSQQEMQFESVRQSEARSYDGGYEASPYSANDYDADHYGQKIAGDAGERISQNAHLREHMLNLRMGMAITSLVLWMCFFLISLFILLSNPVPSIIQPFIIIGMCVFTILVILANVLINRKPL
jgi:hypothetical protein